MWDKERWSFVYHFFYLLTTVTAAAEGGDKLLAIMDKEIVNSKCSETERDGWREETVSMQHAFIHT